MDQLELQEKEVCQELQDLLENLETVEPTDPKDLTVTKAHLVIKVRPANKDLKEPQARREYQGNLVEEEQPVQMVCLEHKELRGPLEHKDFKDFKGKLEQMEKLEIQERAVLLEDLVFVENLELKDLEEAKDYPARLGYPVVEVSQVNKVCQDLLDFLVFLLIKD